METHVNKTQVTAKASDNFSADQQTMRYGATVSDNRIAAVVQRRLKEMARNSRQVKQLQAIQKMVNDSRQNQFAGLPATSGVIQMERPGWINPASEMIRRSKAFLGNEAFDLAHRLSYNDIETTITTGTKAEKTDMIDRVTIPARNFGNIGSDDPRYNHWVKQSGSQGELLSRLNSSPFNLRPGNPSTNRGIGKAFDPNARDSGRLTPQSRTLRPFAQEEEDDLRSSTAMDDTTFAAWEAHVYTADLPDTHS